MKYFDKELGRERYFDKNGDEINAGDFIKLTPHSKPQQVYTFEDEYGDIGLGTDATNPVWIEKGKAYPCEYGIYPLTFEDTQDCELCPEPKHV